jgi:hypothetical protein
MDLIPSKPQQVKLNSSDDNNNSKESNGNCVSEEKEIEAIADENAQKPSGVLTTVLLSKDEA